MCADLSWKMRLASVLDILSSLISLRYLFEGREGSMSLVFVARVEAFHSMFQRALIRVFLCCLSADLFCFSGLRSRGGRSLSSKLLSHLTAKPIAEKKNWEAATSNNPKLSSRNDDRVARHRSEMVCRCACVRLGFSRGDTSSGTDGPSPLAGKSEPRDET